MFKKVIFYLNAFLLSFLANAQGNNIKIGEWRAHLPYNIAWSLDASDDKTYVTADVNAFYINHSDNSTQTLSTINGLSDVEVSKVRYNKNMDLVVLAYANGNIDILRSDNSVINVNDIERKNIIGSKKINEITFQGNYAYLCCDFGVSVLDLKKFEIKETYNNLAPGGLVNKVFGCAFSSDGDSIFLATEKGVMTAKNSPGINLMDFANWFTYGPANNISTTNIQSICNFQNKIFVGVLNDNISYLMGATWVESPITLGYVRSMRVSMGKLLACTDWGILVADTETSFTFIYNASLMAAAVEAVLDDNNQMWIADVFKGLLSYNFSNSTFTSHVPNGPSSRHAFDIYYANEKIIVTKGGYSNGFGFSNRNGEYYIFDNYSWKTYNSSTPGFPPVNELVVSKYNPHDNKLYFPTYGFGLLIANPDNTYSLIDGAPFNRSLPTPGPYVYITDAVPDNDGNLWITNTFVPSASSPSLHVLKPNGTFGPSKSFGFEAGRYPIQLLIDKNDQKWIRPRPDIAGGIIVYDDKNNLVKYLIDHAGQGGLPNKKVRTIVEDKKGEIWVGTEEGVAVFYNPENIFSSSPSDAVTPIYDGFPLLYNEFITCIKVDGGNRKWIGTKNGLWLFNDDGSEALAYYTTANSPLLSNSILDVEIHEKTGEVFISTDKGLISFRGTATESKKEHSDVKVFPNPVKPDYTGLIGISGLTTDANIKITDITGTLIYETKAEGGTAVWNGKNYNGEKAKTGVYLIFSSSDDGEETFISKIAVIE